MDLNEELQNSGLKGLLGSTRLYNKLLAGFALLILSNRDMENIYLGKYLFNKKNSEYSDIKKLIFFIRYTHIFKYKIFIKFL